MEELEPPYELCSKNHVQDISCASAQRVFGNSVHECYLIYFHKCSRNVFASIIHGNCYKFFIIFLVLLLKHFKQYFHVPESFHTSCLSTSKSYTYNDYSLVLNVSRNSQRFEGGQVQHFMTPKIEAIIGLGYLQ